VSDAEISDDRCRRCTEQSDDLRVVLFWGRERRGDRLVCDRCAEELYQLFMSQAAAADATHSEHS
jgi:ribosomal protein L37E